MALPRASLFVVLSVVLAFLALYPTGQSSSAGSFTASTAITLSSTSTGANADSTIVFSIPSPDYNFSLVVNASPAASSLAPGPGHPSFNATANPALGDIVGSLTSSTFLGITNNPCNSSLTVNFTFLNATVDVTDTIDPVPQSATNTNDGGTLANQWTDDGASPSADPPWNAPWSGLTAAERTNGLPAEVDDYPSYLNTIFTPDGGSPVQPNARYAGATNVAGTVVTLNLVVFGPDVLANAFPAPHPFNDLRGIGYTSIAVLQNPVAEAAPSAITDFCTPLAVTTLVFGQSKTNTCNGSALPPCNTAAGINVPAPGGNTGKNRYNNPSSAGTYLWVSFHQSLRDSDGDGKENAFDTCPLDSDTLNQRTGAGPDGDVDGIADICDNSSTPPVDDSDTDGWQNRGDNCPQASNPSNVESENPPTTYLTAAKRGGPRIDGLGDACDNTGGNSPTVANGAFETTLSTNAICIGGTDGDGDGYCTVTSPASENDPNDGNSNIKPEDYDLVLPMAVAHSGSGIAPPMRQPKQVCNDGVDQDLDGLFDNKDLAAGSSTCRPKGLPAHPGFPACPAVGCPGIDSDGDGWTDEAEILIGTDALGRCNTGAIPFISNDWPADFDSTGIPNSIDKVTLIDLTSFLGPVYRLNTTPASASYDSRWDLVPGPTIGSNWIQLDDLTSLLGGSTGFPPMFSGAKIFNGATCTTVPGPYGD